MAKYIYFVSRGEFKILRKVHLPKKVDEKEEAAKIKDNPWKMGRKQSKMMKGYGVVPSK